MQVLSVASEVYPLVKTGGLGGRGRARCRRRWRAEGVQVRTLLPGYPAVTRGAGRGRDSCRARSTLFGGPRGCWRARAGGLDLFVLDAPHLFARPGNPYLGPDGRDWPDNALRFAALARVGAQHRRTGCVPDLRPDIVHAHDWQAGLAPAYLHYDGGAAARRP